MQQQVYQQLFGAILTLRHLLQAQESLEQSYQKIPARLRALLPVTGTVLLAAAALQLAVPAVQDRLR